MMAKFVEHEHEKVDRTIELLIKYKYGDYQLETPGIISPFREKLAKYEAKKAKRRHANEEDLDDDPDR